MGYLTGDIISHKSVENEKIILIKIPPPKMFLGDD